MTRNSLPVTRASALPHIRTRRTRRGAGFGLSSLRCGLLAAMLLMLFAPFAALPVAAQAPPLGAPAGQWREKEATATGRFEIWFAQRGPVAAQVDAYKQVADPAGEMMEDIFGRVLARGMGIYLFTDEAQFNMLPGLPKDDPAVFSHIDRNGIYVSASRSAGLKPVDLGRNLRGLLARETAAQLSGGHLPAGLLEGVERYAQAPPADLQALVGTLNGVVGADRLAGWNTLLNQTDPEADAQTYSVVAFLMDIYGFRTFRTYLDRVRETRDWRTAIPRAYLTGTNSTPAMPAPAAGATAPPPAAGESVMSLEMKWRAYLPQFLGGLWQRNQFTFSNTEEASRLVAAGQYTQAVMLLTPAIPFLQQISNTRRAADAQSLLSRARAGAAAESTLRDAQQALEGNDYERTLTLVSQAKTEFESLGKDARPSPLLRQYEERANRGKTATADLTVAETAVGGWNVLLARQRADRALGTFTEYGNTPLADRAQSVIDRANGEIRTVGLGTIGVGLTILLLGMTISSVRRARRHPVATLPPLE